MKITTGTARGRLLKTLEGTDTRPTSDKVKQAVFNSLQYDIEGRFILDLFAGSGQMGIEALSRGAAGCVFVDISPDAVKIVRENIKSAGFEDKAIIYTSDAFDFLKNAGGYDLDKKIGVAFLDPPYKAFSTGRGVKNLSDITAALAGSGIMAEYGIIVAECARAGEVADRAYGFTRYKSAFYGRTAIHYYRI